MANFQDRVTKLERLHRPRPWQGLSSARRKCLTDKAVREGDREALREINLHRLRIIQASPHQRAAALAAGLRADT
jgi:hypothetical protein